MWEMTQNSIALFFRGKLFADPGKVARQLLIGIVVTAVLLIGGGLQPYLFKDLRYL
jgi:hypothetical protein